jgi:hypothetical protein
VGPPTEAEGFQADQEAQAELQERLLDIRREWGESRLEIERDINEGLADYSAKRGDINEEELTQEQKRQGDLNALRDQTALILKAGIDESIITLTQSLVEGNANIGQLMLSIVAGVITSLGVMLIQLGTAGVLAGLLGTVIPILAGLTGGALGLATGAAVLAGGIAMVALGSAMGSAVSSPGKTPAAKAGRGGGGSSGSSRAPAGPNLGNRIEAPGGNNGTPTQTVLNLNFGRGFVVGTKREVGRAVADALAGGGFMVPENAGG